MSREAQVEDEFKALAATGEAADAMVFAELVGGELQTLHVNRELLDPGRQRDLESAVKQAVNRALVAQQEAVTAFVKSHGGGANRDQLDRIEAQLDQIIQRRKR